MQKIAVANVVQALQGMHATLHAPLQLQALYLGACLAVSRSVCPCESSVTTATADTRRQRQDTKMTITLPILLRLCRFKSQTAQNRVRYPIIGEDKSAPERLSMISHVCYPAWSCPSTNMLLKAIM